MTRPVLRLVVSSLLLLGAGRARAESIRCDGGIVSTGDTKLDLLGKCGEPSLVEVQYEERQDWAAGDPPWDGVAPVGAGRLSLSVERWTYNFGASAFLQFVTVEGGRVMRIERGGYGQEQNRSGAPFAVPRARCEHSSLRVGQSSFEVLSRCGPPATRDATVLERVDELFGAPGVITTSRVVVELWVYDFGPQVLTRRLEFSGGKLRRIETGGYGYSR